MITLSERDTVSWRNDAIASTLRQTTLFANADTSVISDLVQACALIRSKPDLAISMLVSMSAHLKHLVLMIDDLKFKQIENRLANWLDRNASAAAPGDPRRRVDLPMSKKLLASRLGVTSETLSRAFARLRHEGIIEVNGRSIAILDPEAMRKYL